MVLVYELSINFDIGPELYKKKIKNSGSKPKATESSGTQTTNFRVQGLKPKLTRSSMTKTTDFKVQISKPKFTGSLRTKNKIK